MDKTALLPNGQMFEFWEKEQVYEKEIHVNKNHPTADDSNAGSMDAPFKTIQAAAQLATPGTRVLIHGGEYREWVHPLYGGTDAEHMVCYEAYGDGEVIIKASEVVTDFKESFGWNKYDVEFDVLNGEELDVDSIKIWEHKLDPDMFRGYNPFCAVNIIHDRFYIEFDKTDMTTYLNRRGMVFCDGKPLQQVPMFDHISFTEDSYWVEANGQKIHFRLANDDDPANHLIEISCREQCFAPDIPFLSYIKVKGLTCAHASMGAPIPQRGAISCYRGHHWIIEDCKVDWSNALGIDVGDECWHHEIDKERMTGYSVIRRCTILDAGVCGIAGLFARNMLVEDNYIEGTGWQKMELSWEAGGIKVHNSVDSLFRRNILKNTFRADHLWMDCGNENNRITGNLFLDGIEQREAIFMECTKDGINLIDNNIIWNVEGRFDPAKVPAEPGSSGWYKLTENDAVNGYGIYAEGTDRLYIANNLIGRCRSAGYFAKPVSFRMKGVERGGTSRDNHFINNIFYDCKEAAIKMPTKDNESEGNLFVKMQGGYLRVIYPQPQVCLHLPAWQEFMGFDKNGQDGWFNIDVDTDNYEVRFSLLNSRLSGFGNIERHRNYVYSPADVKPVEKDALIGTDFFGEELTGSKCLPGPFKALGTEITYSVDPRKTNLL